VRFEVVADLLQTTFQLGAQTADEQAEAKRAELFVEERPL
jgi:hypothetical protein